MQDTHTSYIYAGQLQAMFNWDSPPVIKIGKADTPQAREIQLSRTKIPFNMKFIRLWEIPEKVVLAEESWLHEFFDSIRVDGTEYFSDPDGVLVGKLDMLMKAKGFPQVIDLHEEQIREEIAQTSTGSFQKFWDDFDRIVPNGIKPTSKVRNWGRYFSAGKGFSYEYQPRTSGSFVSLWVSGNKQDRIDVLYDETNQKLFRGLFDNIEFNSEQTRIKVYVDGNRNENPHHLQQNMINAMDIFEKTMTPIIRSLK